MKTFLTIPPQIITVIPCRYEVKIPPRLTESKLKFKIMNISPKKFSELQKKYPKSEVKIKDKIIIAAAILRTH